MLSMARFKALSRVRQRSDAPLDEEYAAGVVDEADEFNASNPANHCRRGRN
jgi:hypothetical protein